MRQLVFLALLSMLVSPPIPAHAEGDDTCTTECSGGEKMVSYADGNSVHCACVPEATMEETVPDPTVVEGVVNTDT